MSKRVKELFLYDILVAILKIKHYSKDFDNALSLKYDCKSWDAVIREFEIIGEATNNLIKLNYFKKDKREIVDFRNILIHEYFGVDEDEIWDIINNFLDIFEIEIVNSIKNIEPSLKNKITNQILDENSHIDFVTDVIKKLW